MVNEVGIEARPSTDAATDRMHIEINHSPRRMHTYRFRSHAAVFDVNGYMPDDSCRSILRTNEHENK